MRNLARGLFLVAGALLLGCSTMTGIFGWWQGTTLIGSITTAAVFVAADWGGAIFTTLSGTCAANKEPGAAKGFGIVAFVCMALTLFGILGFQGENREMRAATRENSAKAFQGFVDWAEALVAKEHGGPAPKAKGKPPEGLESSIEAVGKTVTKQLEMLNSGQLAPMSDGQAVTIARVSGLSEAQARSWTVTVTSFALLIIQYVAWWGYGFCRQKLEPKISGIVHGPRGENVTDNVTDNVAKISKQDARNDILALVANGIELSNRECALRWGVPDTRASQWRADFVQEGIMRKVLKNGRKVAVAPRHMNGNGSAKPN